MKVQQAVSIQDILDTQTFLGISVGQLLLIISVAVVAFIFERVVTRYLRRFARHAHLSLSASNNIILVFRILILFGSAAFMTRAGGLATEWFLAFSALGGAALGFASSQTIGNFVAGLFLLAARPFKVGDYIRVGTVEGIVQEITINYTRILTIGSNVVSIINLQVLQRDITSFQDESQGSDGLCCYTFEIGFDHSVSTDKIAAIFDKVFELHMQTLPKKPRYMLLRSGSFERVYMVYLYVKDPREVFVLRPQIAEEVFRRWDAERAKGHA